MSEHDGPNPYVTENYTSQDKLNPELLRDLPFDMRDVDNLHVEVLGDVMERQRELYRSKEFTDRLFSNTDVLQMSKEQFRAAMAAVEARAQSEEAITRATNELVNDRGLDQFDENDLALVEQRDILADMLSLSAEDFREFRDEPTIEKLKELKDREAAELQTITDAAKDENEGQNGAQATNPTAPKPQPSQQSATPNNPSAAKPDKPNQPQQPETIKQKVDMLEGLPVSWEEVAEARRTLRRNARTETEQKFGTGKPKDDAEGSERSLYRYGKLRQAASDYIEKVLPYGTGEDKKAIDKKRDTLKAALLMQRDRFEKNQKDAAEAQGTPEVQTGEDTVDIIGIMNGSVVPETGTDTNPTANTSNGENATQNQPENGERNKGKYRVGDYILYRENDGSMTEAMIVGASNGGFQVRELNILPDGTRYERLTNFNNDIAAAFKDRLDDQASAGEILQREERFGIRRGFNFNVVSREGFRYNCEVIAFPDAIDGVLRLTVLDTGVDPNGRPYQRAHDVVGAADIQKFLNFALRTKQGEAQAQAQAEAARQRAEAEQNRPQGNPAFEALTVPEPDLNDDERQELRQNPFLQRDRYGRLIPTPRLLAGSRLEVFARQMLASRQFVRPNQNMVDAVMRDLQAANPQLVRAQNDRNPVVFTNQRVNLNWGSIDYMERNKQVPRIDHFIVQNNISDFAGLARELLAMGGISFEVKGKEAQEQLARQTDRVVRALAGANNTPPYGRYLNPGRINVTPDVWNLVDQIATGRQNGNRNRR